MKKQLFLTALMAVTAFSAQGSAGFLARSAFSVLAGGLAAETYLLSSKLNNLNFQTESLIEEVSEFLGTLLHNAPQETIVQTVRNSSFARKTIIAGTVAAAAVYYGIKARKHYAHPTEVKIESLAEELHQTPEWVKKNQ